MAEVNILIVDDSRTSKRILRNLLESQGYNVVAEAADGEEGYLKYQEVKPDLVTALLEDGCNGMRTRTFAVGTRDVDAAEVFVRMTEMLVESKSVL